MKTAIAKKQIGSVNLEAIRKPAISQTMEALRVLATDSTHIIGRKAQPYEITSLFSRLATDLYAECMSGVLNDCGAANAATMKDVASACDDEHALRFVMDKILFPEIAIGNEKAAALLCYYAVYLDSGEKKLAKEMLAKAGALASGKTIVAKSLDHVLTFDRLDRSLLHVLFEVDKTRALELAQRYIHVGDDEERSEALFLISGQENPDWYYRNALEYCKFWERKALRSEIEPRLAYYALVRKAFDAKGISAEKALDYLRPAFKYEAYERGFAPLAAAITAVDPQNAQSIISEGLITALNGKEPTYLEGPFKKHLASLTGEKRTSFLANVLRRTNDEDQLWEAGHKLLASDITDDVCRVFSRAMNSRTRIHALCQLILCLTTDKHGFDDLRKGRPAADLLKLREVAIAGMDKAKTIPLALAFLHEFAFHASEAEAAETLKKAEWLADRTHNDAATFRGVIHLIWVFRSRQRNCRAAADATLSSLMLRYEKRVISIAHEAIRKDLRYGIEWIGRQAAEFLTTITHLPSVPVLGKLLNSKESNHDGKRYLVGFLKRIIVADERLRTLALDFLCKNDGCDISHDLIATTLHRIYQGASDENLKTQVVEVAVARLIQAVKKPDYLSAITEAETVEAMKQEAAARRGFIRALSLMPESDRPLPGFAIIINRTKLVISGKEWTAARTALAGIVKHFTELVRSKRDQLSRYHYEEYAREIGHIITAAHEQLLELS